jgi:hypothetical protein
MVVLVADHHLTEEVDSQNACTASQLEMMVEFEDHFQMHFGLTHI